jgi:hypothetical protein
MSKAKQPDTIAPAVEIIYRDIKSLIEEARTHVVTQVNQTLVLTYWQIGKTIKTEVLNERRAQYGANTLRQLAGRLAREYGNGFTTVRLIIE